MLKRIVAVVLCAVMSVATLASCTVTKKNEDDKGAIIRMYMTQEVYDFDPAYSFKNDAAQKVVSLLFSGLFKINENGKVEKELAKSYTIDKTKNSMNIVIDPKATWSDGTYVSANDVVYTFKRLLKPQNNFEAACLLFDVKNARTVKNATSEYYLDDIGIYPVGEQEVEITFEDGFTNYDQFLRNLASPALVPLREDIVSINDGDWAKKPGTMSCSGPFMLRKVSYAEDNKSLTLERNPYYFRQKDDKVDKTVRPYKLVVDFTKSAEEQYEMFQRGEIFYLGDIALSLRGQVKAKVTDAMSTASVYLNENAYVGKHVRTLDQEPEPKVSETTDEATGKAKIVTTYAKYYTYYNYMSQEQYDRLHPNRPYEEIVEKDLKDYTIDTEKTKSYIVEEGDVLKETRYVEYRYTIREGSGADRVNYTTVDVPSGKQIFADANVRKALSLVIDRNAIANKVVYAKAATALIPYGLMEGSNAKKDFRQVGGGILATEPNQAEAAALLQKSGITPSDYEFQLSVRAEDEVHCAIGEELQKAWESLGFKVLLMKVEPITNIHVGSTNEVSTDIKDDIINEKLFAENYQATLVDFVANSANAFSSLAPFATEFAGNSIDMMEKDEEGNYLYTIKGNLTRFKSAAYNEKIEAAFAEKNDAARDVILHEAERILMDEMPIIPIVFNQDAYLISKELSGTKNSFFNNRIFTKTKQKNYEKYLEATGN